MVAHRTLCQFVLTLIVVAFPCIGLSQEDLPSEAGGRINPRNSVDYTDLLPAAPDPNFFLSSPFAPTGQFADGYATSQSFLGAELYSRIGGSANLAAMYDTGFVDPFTPSGVALDGTMERRKSGSFAMDSTTGNTNGKLIWDVQSRPIGTTAQTQAFLELDYIDGDVAVRNVFGRIVSDVTTINFGQSQTFAAHNAALPTSLVGKVRPVGSLSKEKVTSLSFTRAVTNYVELGFAVENPGADFFLADPMADVKLSRFPTMIGRVRVTGENLWDGLHFAAFTRGFGQENVAGAEDWVYGWGLSGVARKAIGDRNRIYLGASGGEGVGDYIFGVENGAGPTPGGLTTLSAVGAYAGLAHLWNDDCYNGQLWSNFVVGYSYQDAPALLPHTTTSIKRARQAFANLIWQASDNLAFGVEYQYLDRDVRNGLSGDNHRIGFVLMVATPSPKTASPSSGNMPSAQSYGERAPGTMYLRSL